MITFHNGDLLKSGCDIICHQVNEYGVMGAGIALQIKEQFPTVCDTYKRFVAEIGSKRLGLYGRVLFAEENGVQVANCFSQIRGETSGALVWHCAELVLKRAKSIVHRKGKATVGIPDHYGSGIAKGDWEDILSTWTDIFKYEKNIELQVWKLQKVVDKHRLKCYNGCTR